MMLVGYLVFGYVDPQYNRSSMISDAFPSLCRLWGWKMAMSLEGPGFCCKWICGGS